MKVEIVYPVLNRYTKTFLKIRKVVEVLLIAAAIACAVTNIFVKGKAWSVVAIWGMFMVWNLIFSPDNIEFNLISQIVKVVVYTLILLVLIEVCLVHGFALIVVPIILFSTLIITSGIVFLDINSQISNTMPMIWLTLFSFVGVIITTYVFKQVNWAIIVLGAVAGADLFVFVVFNGEFRQELKKRFHTNKK